MKSLQVSVQSIEQTMQELKTRVESLENSSYQLNNAIIQTQDLVSNVSSTLTSLKSSAVTNLQLGESETTRIFDGHGFLDSYGYIITSVYNTNSDNFIDYVSRRKLRIQINGAWVNIY